MAYDFSRSVLAGTTAHVGQNYHPKPQLNFQTHTGDLFRTDNVQREGSLAQANSASLHQTKRRKFGNGSHHPLDNAYLSQAWNAKYSVENSTWDTITARPSNPVSRVEAGSFVPAEDAFSRGSIQDSKPQIIAQPVSRLSKPLCLPFIIEDDSEDEPGNDHRSMHSTYQQSNKPSDFAQARAEERLKSQKLRQQAAERKQVLVRQLTCDISPQPFGIIDLCSPEPPSPKEAAKTHNSGVAQSGRKTIPTAKPTEQHAVFSGTKLPVSRNDAPISSTVVNKGTEKAGRKNAGQNTSSSVLSSNEHRTKQKCHKGTDTPGWQNAQLNYDEQPHNPDPNNSISTKDHTNFETPALSVANDKDSSTQFCEMRHGIGNGNTQHHTTSCMTNTQNEKEDEDNDSALKHRQAIKLGRLGGHLDMGKLSRQVAGDSDLQQRRKERIQRMQERNEQNREVTPGEEAKEIENSNLSYPNPTPEYHPTFVDNAFSKVNTTVSGKRDVASILLKSRIASLVGQQAEAETSRTKVKPRNAPSSTSKTTSVQLIGGKNKRTKNRKTHDRQLGELLLEDFQLLRWRKTGVNWADVVLFYVEATGKKRSEETLKRRCRQVAAALKRAGIKDAMTDRAAVGDQEAIRQINQMIHNSHEVDLAENGVSTRLPLDDGPKRELSKRSGSPEAENNEVDSSQIEMALMQAFSEEDSGEVLEPTAAVSEGQGSAHPTVGGKTINWSNWLSMIRGPSEESDVESCPESSQYRVEPISEEDYCHFIYKVEYRECSLDVMDTGLEMDDVVWIECSGTYEALYEANAAAAKQVYQSMPGSPQYADPEGDFIVSQRTDENGMKVFTLENQELGRVETRVVRRMRFFHDKVFPKTPEGMMRRIAYIVKWKITQKLTGDDLFDCSGEQIEQGDLGAVFTIAEIANQQAVQHYVDLVFKSPLANLESRRQEKQQMVNNLIGELDDDDEKNFNKTSGEGTDKIVQVWVEKVPIKGPRNLY